jgi:hypothetical protein
VQAKAGKADGRGQRRRIDPGLAVVEESGIVLQGARRAVGDFEQLDGLAVIEAGMKELDLEGQAEVASQRVVAPEPDVPVLVIGEVGQHRRKLGGRRLERTRGKLTDPVAQPLDTEWRGLGRQRGTRSTRARPSREPSAHRRSGGRCKRPAATERSGAKGHAA